MKILLISSSPHKEKSNTYILSKEVLKGVLEQGAVAETIHLSDCYIDFCLHCDLCHRRLLHCSVKDTASGILYKMLEADGIILASPNYINQITASMKVLLERTAHFIHCKRLLGKYVAGVVTSGSGRDKDVLGYIEHYAHTCGAQYCGGVSASAYALEEKFKEAYQLGKKIFYDINSKAEFPGQLKIIEEGREHFRRIIQSRKEDWVEEYKYWQGKGWL